MTNMLHGDNWGLIVPRQAATDNWSHVQITKYMADNRIHYSNKGIAIQCPLYIYSNTVTGEIIRTVNMDIKILKKIADGMNSVFYDSIEDCTTENAFNELELLDYIYAVLYSEQYRTKYKEFLKFDFPRVPFPSDLQYFKRLANCGKALRILHTSESTLKDCDVDYVGPNNILIETPHYASGSIIFNKVGDKLTGVNEEIWNMYFGGYKHKKKWLKDRKNMQITMEEIKHYSHIYAVLNQTKKIMKQISEIIEV